MVSVDGDCVVQPESDDPVVGQEEVGDTNVSLFSLEVRNHPCKSNSSLGLAENVVEVQHLGDLGKRLYLPKRSSL